jgi:hypothetical protein
MNSISPTLRSRVSSFAWDLRVPSVGCFAFDGVGSASVSRSANSRKSASPRHASSPSPTAASSSEESIRAPALGRPKHLILEDQAKLVRRQRVRVPSVTPESSRPHPFVAARARYRSLMHRSGPAPYAHGAAADVGSSRLFCGPHPRPVEPRSRRICRIALLS